MPTVEQVPAIRLALVRTFLKRQEPTIGQMPTVEQVLAIILALVRSVFQIQTP